MTLQEILAVKPEGWDIVRFDEAGLTVFRRGEASLTVTKSGKWRVSIEVKGDRDYYSGEYPTPQEAINKVRADIEGIRTKLFEALRDLK
jgi:hypothetical protein